MQEATRKGLQLASQTSASKGALQAISALRGVGPATASAVLAPVHPERFPFMADEAMEGAGVDRTYTEATYMTFSERLRKKAQQLGGQWSAEAVGRALWAAAIMDAFKLPSQPPASGATDQQGESSAASGRKKKSAADKKPAGNGDSAGDARLEQAASAKADAAKSAEKRVRKAQPVEEDVDEAPERAAPHHEEDKRRAGPRRATAGRAREQIAGADNKRRRK